MDYNGIHLILFVTFLFLQGTSALSAKGQQLINSLDEYHIFKPIQHNLNHYNEKRPINTLLDEKRGLHISETEVSFVANNKRYDLILTLNEDLISTKFSTCYTGPNNTYIYETPTAKDVNNCYYHGYVKGYNSSTVVADTCNGLRGTIFLPYDVLQFEPIDESNSMHVMYRSSFNVSHSCGTNVMRSFHDSMIEEKQYSRFRRDAETEEKKFIELLFVADQNEFKLMGTREKLYDYVKQLINYIDAMYKKIGLRVVLLHVEVWENGDKIEFHDDASTVLNNFLAYRKDRIQKSPSSNPWRYTDNAQLLYGSSFRGSTVGMATVSSMCGLRSGGVNEDRGNAMQTAATVSHEMGHNMGMSHDSPKCSCEGTKCVMASTASSKPPDTWSDCSVEYLKQGYKYGTANCLLNVPDSSRLFGGPLCGNGIVETGEQCDCGYPDECISQCCNATTCQLLSHAHCDDGACCTTDCNFKSSCSICRPLGNDCDIAEYCTGRSSHCPGNIHKIDGMDCGSGQGLCYGGVCRTHEMQCQEIWGPDATNGDGLCYTGVNKIGDANGNCGKVNGTFRKCEPENAICGKLLCTGGESYPLIASDRIFYRNMVGGFTCKSLISTEDSSDVGDVGLVWDGTKCAEGKMCFGGICEDLQNIVKQCSADCHGRGVCNNYGNCHCESGWGPPDCSRKGNGGSGDSGPICENNTDMQVVLLLVFFLIILPIILGLFFYIWWRYCGGRPKMYAWRKIRKQRKQQGKPPKTQKAPSLENLAPNRTDEEKLDNKRTVQPNPIRPPPPARPSPLLPIRSAPVKPSVPVRKPPQPPRPPPAAPKPTPKTPDVIFHSKPQIKKEDDSSQQQTVSIQDRIKRLQSNNAV